MNKSIFTQNCKVVTLIWRIWKHFWQIGKTFSRPWDFACNLKNIFLAIWSYVYKVNVYKMVFLKNLTLQSERYNLVNVFPVNPWVNLIWRLGTIFPDLRVRNLKIQTVNINSVYTIWKIIFRNIIASRNISSNNNTNINHNKAIVIIIIMIISSTFTQSSNPTGKLNANLYRLRLVITEHVVINENMNLY